MNTFKAATGSDPASFYPELGDFKDFLGLFKNIVRPDIKEVKEQENFTDAPWPQPSPHMPDSLAATVLKVPPAEIKHFVDTVVARYISTLRFDWVKASYHVFEHPTAELMSDAEINRLFTTTMFGRFLNPTLDEEDRITFASQIREGQEYLKADFSPMEKVHCFDGIYSYPTIGLFEKHEGTVKLKAIKVGDQVLVPMDGDHWKLAKLYLLNGALMTGLLCVHPRVHFPMDAVVAITRSVLPKDHVLFQLLEPHLYMQLPLNFAVLYVNKSLIRNNQNEIYTPFCGKIDGALELMKAGFEGVEGNSSYPPYEFPMDPLEIHTDYGEFLASYDQVVEDFVKKVSAFVTVDDPLVRRWAKHVSQFVPGFPSEDQLENPHTLVRAVTSIIMDVSVIHSADHYSLATVPINKAPLRIRIPMPRKESHFKLDLTRVMQKQDIFRHYMAHTMYFQTSTLKHLKDVEYPFTIPDLKQAADAFKGDLKRLDRQMKTRRYIPLDDIATSIQY